MNDCNTLLNLMTTGVDVLVLSRGRPRDVTVLRVFPVAATDISGERRVVFDVQNVAEEPLAIAPVVTAVFRASGDCDVVCDIRDVDRTIPMGTTKRFTATVRGAGEAKQPPGALYQVHIGLRDSQGEVL